MSGGAGGGETQVSKAGQAPPSSPLPSAALALFLHRRQPPPHLPAATQAKAPDRGFCGRRQPPPPGPGVPVWALGPYPEVCGNVAALTPGHQAHHGPPAKKSHRLFLRFQGPQILKSPPSTLRSLPCEFLPALPAWLEHGQARTATGSSAACPPLTLIPLCAPVPTVTDPKPHEDTASGPGPFLHMALGTVLPLGPLL